MISCIRRTYANKYDSQYLNNLASIINAGLQNKNRNIKNNALQFWNDTFGGQDELVYPKLLIPTLTTLKTKATLSLPSWIKQLEDTTNPNTDNSIPEGIYDQTLPNATLAFASDLDEVGQLKGGLRSQYTMSETNQNVNSSSSPKSITQDKQNNITQAISKKYVAITNSKPKKRPLTDHQEEKEILQNKQKAITCDLNPSLSQEVETKADERESSVVSETALTDNQADVNKDQPLKKKRKLKHQTDSVSNTVMVDAATLNQWVHNLNSTSNSLNQLSPVQLLEIQESASNLIVQITKLLKNLQRTTDRKSVQ